MIEMMYLIILFIIFYVIAKIFLKCILLLYFNLSLDKPLTFIQIGKCIFELKVSEWEKEITNI